MALSTKYWIYLSKWAQMKDYEMKLWGLELFWTIWRSFLQDMQISPTIWPFPHIWKKWGIFSYSEPGSGNKKALSTYGHRRWQRWPSFPERRWPLAVRRAPRAPSCSGGWEGSETWHLLISDRYHVTIEPPFQTFTFLARCCTAAGGSPALSPARALYPAIDNDLTAALHERKART